MQTLTLGCAAHSSAAAGRRRCLRHGSDRLGPQQIREQALQQTRTPTPALHISELPLDGVAVSAMASIAPGHSRPTAKQRSIAPCYRSIAKQCSKCKPWCLDGLCIPQMGLDGAAIIATWMCCTFFFFLSDARKRVANAGALRIAVVTVLGPQRKCSQGEKAPLTLQTEVHMGRVATCATSAARRLIVGKQQRENTAKQQPRKTKTKHRKEPPGLSRTTRATN